MVNKELITNLTVPNTVLGRKNEKSLPWQGRWLLGELNRRFCLVHGFPWPQLKQMERNSSFRSWAILAFLRCQCDLRGATHRELIARPRQWIMRSLCLPNLAIFFSWQCKSCKSLINCYFIKFFCHTVSYPSLSVFLSSHSPGPWISTSSKFSPLLPFAVSVPWKLDLELCPFP